MIAVAWRARGIARQGCASDESYLLRMALRVLALQLRWRQQAVPLWATIHTVLPGDGAWRLGVSRAPCGERAGVGAVMRTFC